MASTLPRLPLFEAISKHDPDSTAVAHCLSGRTFRYGELLPDVARTRDQIYEAAGRTDIWGERVAFLVENSYDYVGMKRIPEFNILPRTPPVFLTP
jgi:malonyl-CoA/methylmalonyl-CoA synthetase